MKQPGVFSIIWLVVAILIIAYFASKFVVNVDERSSLDQPERPTEQRPWQTFEYRNRKVAQRLSSKLEVEKAGEPGRPLEAIQNFYERGLLQENGKNYTDRIPTKRKFVNHFQKDWMNKFAQKVLRFQEPQTKLLVNHLGSFLIWRKDNQGQYVEEVELVLILPNGKTSAAQGLVDSEHGTPLHYWNRSQQETGLHEKLILSLDPTAIRQIDTDGHIGPPNSSSNDEEEL